MDSPLNPLNTPNYSTSGLSPGDNTLNRNISSSINIDTSDEEDGFTATQPVDQRILKDVVAYVEVRTNADNRSKGVMRELAQLGAVIAKKFTYDVTHVVFKDGKKSTRDRALKRGLHLVTVLWVDSCKRNQAHVSERMYPVVIPDDKNTPVIIGKLRKAKSMQPKDFDEDVASCAERGEKRRRRNVIMNRWKTLQGTPTNMSPVTVSRVLAPETQAFSPFSPEEAAPNITIPDTPPSMRERLEKENEEDTNRNQDKGNGSYALNGLGDSPVCSQVQTTPLQRRLFENAQKDSPDIDTSATMIALENISKPGTHKRRLLRLQALSTPPSVLLEPHKATNTMQKKGTLYGVKKVAFKDARVNVTKEKEQKRGRKRKSETAESIEMELEEKSGKRMKTDVKGSSAQHSREVQGELTKTDKINSSSSDKLCKPQNETSKSCQKDLKKKQQNNVTENVPKPPPTEIIKRRRSVRFNPTVESNVDEIQNEVDSNTSDTHDGNECAEVLLISTETNKKGRRRSINLKNSEKNDSRNLQANIAGNNTSLKSTELEGRRRRSRRSSMPIHHVGTPSVTTQERVTRRRSGFGAMNNVKTPVHAMTSNVNQSGVKDLTSRSEIGIGKQNPTIQSVESQMEKQLERLKDTTESTSESDSESSKGNLVATNKFNSTNDASESDLDSTCDSSSTQSRSIAFEKLAKSRRSIDEFALPRSVSVSKKRVPKVFNLSSSNSESEQSNSSGEVTKKEKIKKKRNCDKPKCSIVMTSLHSHEQDVVQAVVKKLGGFSLSESVNETTTHVICGGARRTLNVLHGILRGTWLLSQEWVLKSLEAGHWIEEEPYELKEEFPAGKVSRLVRCPSNGEVPFQSDLFVNTGVLFVSDNTAPPPHQLAALITLGGGKVTSCLRKADVCVGLVKKTLSWMVSEQWILDSITGGQVLPVDDYLLNREARASSPEF